MEQAALKVAAKFSIYNKVYQVPSIWKKPRLTKSSRKKSTILTNKINIPNRPSYFDFKCISLLTLLFPCYVLRLILKRVISSTQDPDFNMVASFLCIIFFAGGFLIATYNYTILIHHKELSFVITELKKLRNSTMRRKKLRNLSYFLLKSGFLNKLSDSVKSAHKKQPFKSTLKIFPSLPIFFIKSRTISK